MGRKKERRHHTPVLALNTYECVQAAVHLTSHVKDGMWPRLQDVWFDRPINDGYLFERELLPLFYSFF